MSDEQKSVYKMKLHETLSPKGTDTLIMRVPGGWIYTSYAPYTNYYPDGRTDTEFRASSVFVPITKEGAEHE